MQSGSLLLRKETEGRIEERRSGRVHDLDLDLPRSVRFDRQSRRGGCGALSFQAAQGIRVGIDGGSFATD